MRFYSNKSIDDSRDSRLSIKSPTEKRIRNNESSLGSILRNLTIVQLVVQQELFGSFQIDDETEDRIEAGRGGGQALDGNDQSIGPTDDFVQSCKKGNSLT